MENLNLLLVEDNEGDVVLAKEALALVDTNISISVAEDGREALKILKQQSPYSDRPKPNAVLLDINLPGLNGKAILGIIKSDPELANIPVIILSTTSSVAEIREVFDLKANWYATKPDKIEDYRQLILNIQYLIAGGIQCNSFESFTIS